MVTKSNDANDMATSKQQRNGKRGMTGDAIGKYTKYNGFKNDETKRVKSDCILLKWTEYS